MRPCYKSLIVLFGWIFGTVISKILNCHDEDECMNISLFFRVSFNLFNSYWPIILGCLCLEFVIRLLIYLWCKYVSGKKDTRFIWTRFFSENPPPPEPIEIINENIMRIIEEMGVVMPPLMEAPQM